MASASTAATPAAFHAGVFCTIGGLITCSPGSLEPAYSCKFMYSPLSARIPAAFKRMAEMRSSHRDATNRGLEFLQRAPWRSLACGVAPTTRWHRHSDGFKLTKHYSGE